MNRWGQLQSFQPPAASKQRISKVRLTLTVQFELRITVLLVGAAYIDQSPECIAPEQKIERLGMRLRLRRKQVEEGSDVWFVPRQ